MPEDSDGPATDSRVSSPLGFFLGGGDGSKGVCPVVGGSTGVGVGAEGGEEGLRRAEGGGEGLRRWTLVSDEEASTLF